MREQRAIPKAHQQPGNDGSRRIDGFSNTSNPFQLANRARARHVARIERRGRLKQENMGFRKRHGPMLDAARDDEKLTFVQPHLPIAEVHSEASLHHQEHLVFMLMMVPEELTLKIGRAHV